jgi:hypothetical protein
MKLAVSRARGRYKLSRAVVRVFLFGTDDTRVLLFWHGCHGFRGLVLIAGEINVP